MATQLILRFTRNDDTQIGDWREMIPTAVYRDFLLLNSFNTAMSTGKKIESDVWAIHPGSDHTYYVINTDSIIYLHQVK